MSAPRLTARFWVDAYLTRLRLADVPAYVLAHGDDTGGAVLVKVATLDGRASLWARRFDPLGERRDWVQDMTGDESEIDARVARERARDRDLWVIEIESRSGATLLDGFEG
jgi:hypothetical protein